MILSRRRLFVGAAALVAAPSIVRVSSLMPISAPRLVPFIEPSEYLRLLTARIVNANAQVFANSLTDLICFGSSVIEHRPDGTIRSVPPSEWHGLPESADLSVISSKGIG